MAMCTARVIRGEKVTVIAAYMRNHLDNARDMRGVVNLTALAEDAANSFDIYKGDGTIPEAMYELAYDVAKAARELEHA